jgi:hypothetical protein
MRIPVSPRADATLELAHCQIDGDWPLLFDVPAHPWRTPGV